MKKLLELHYISLSSQNDINLDLMLKIEKRLEEDEK